MEDKAMKKKYFSPHVEVVIFNAPILLTGSDLINEVSDQEALSRDYEWDDDF